MAEVPGFKYFGEECRALQGIKAALLEKAIAGGVNKSTTSQLVFSRLDAKIEEAILYARHADVVMAYMYQIGEKAVEEKLAGGSADGNTIEFPAKG